jgi:four helix bundle protein
MLQKKRRALARRFFWATGKGQGARGDDADASLTCDVQRYAMPPATTTRFTDLRVWQKSMILVEDVYRLTSSFPTTERFGITSQMRRAAISIPSNIAEGYGRGTRGEYLNQLSVANGSVCELETLLYLAERLSYAQFKALETMRQNLIYVQRMIIALRVALQKKRASNR